MESMKSVQAINKTHKKGISGSTLKIIAIITMVIDHIGAIVIENMLVERGLLEITTDQAFVTFLDANSLLYYMNTVFRIIGRMSFPIFCFLIVQGFLHTHDLKKYLGRMFIFALISEIPFDLAFFGIPFYWGYQNIFFTLFFGILAISGIQIAEKKKEWNKITRLLFGLLSIGLCMGAVIVLKTDYDILGILIISIMYLFRNKKMLSASLGCLVLETIPAFVSLIPIYFYNGEKGRSVKWLFYLFYPVHILLLYFLSFFLI